MLPVNGADVCGEQDRCGHEVVVDYLEGPVIPPLVPGPLGLPEMAVDALRAHKKRQAGERLAAGAEWSDQDLVFCTRTGAALDAANVRREFRAVRRAAKLGEHWTPRELRHSFVSLMSSSGVPVEEIARIAGHSSTRTTEVVYRRELRPILTTGAEAMDRLFKLHASQ